MSSSAHNESAHPFDCFSSGEIIDVDSQYEELLFAKSPEAAREAAVELVRAVLGQEALAWPREDALRECCRMLRPANDPKEQLRFEHEFLELAASVPSALFKEFDNIVVSERQNASINIALLQPYVVAGDLLLRMYQTLFKSLFMARENGLEDNRFDFLVPLLGSCQRGLIIGLDRIMKGYFSDSFHSLRLSTEAACFVYKGFCHAHLMPVWLNSVEGDDKYRDLQNRFTKRFAGNEPALLGLESVFEECCRYCHANPFGVGDFMRVNQGRIEVEYFDFRNEESLTSAFFITIRGHWLIGSLMLPVFNDFFTHEMKGRFLQDLIDVQISADAASGEDEELRQEVISSLVH